MRRDARLAELSQAAAGNQCPGEEPSLVSLSGPECPLPTVNPVENRMPFQEAARNVVLSADAGERFAKASTRWGGGGGVLT